MTKSSLPPLLMMLKSGSSCVDGAPVLSASMCWLQSQRITALRHKTSLSPGLRPLIFDLWFAAFPFSSFLFQVWLMKSAPLNLKLFRGWRYFGNFLCVLEYWAKDLMPKIKIFRWQNSFKRCESISLGVRLQIVTNFSLKLKRNRISPSKTGRKSHETYHRWYLYVAKFIEKMLE